MRKFILTILIMTSSILIVGCVNETEPTPIIPTEPTVIPTEPVPTPEPTFSMSVTGTDQLTAITATDLASKTLRDVSVIMAYEKEKTLVGYRLTDFFSPDSVDGFSVNNDTQTTHYAYHIRDVYLFIGEKADDVVSYYPLDKYHISRVLDRRLDHTTLQPVSLDVRTFNPDEAIYYIDYKSVQGRYDHHTSLRAMQGIINRHQPRLLTLTTGNPYYKYSDETWLLYIESLGYDLIELLSLEEVLYTFKDDFTGIITFRDRFKSYNGWVSGESDVALMLASLMDYAPLPKGLEGTMSTLTGLEVIESFTVNDKTVLGDISTYLDQEDVIDAYTAYEHIFLNFKEAFNTKAYMSLTSEVMDYAASEQMMFFDLKATQSERDNLLSQEINAYFDRNNTYFNVYGWVDQESSALDFISSYGGIIDVVGSGNLSLLSNMPIDTETFTQKATDQSSYDPTKKYVTFFASESDTIKVGVAFQHGAWLDPNRGMVPINWGLISDMSEEFPFVYDYFIQTATDKDYFYSGGGSAIGFVDIDAQMNYPARVAIAEANAYYMAVADQQIIDMYNDKYTATDLYDKTVLSQYFLSSEIEGAFARIHDGNTTIRVESWYGVPVYNRWSNFYPRRGSTSEVSLSAMSIFDTNHYVQNASSNYWFLQADLANTTSEIGFELFRQTDGDGYRVVLKDGRVYVKVIQSGIETILEDLTFTTTNRKIKVSIDKSSSLDPYTRIKLYVNDFKVIEFFDTENRFTSGGFGIYTEDAFSSVVSNLTGTKYSMAQAIYQRIINDPNRFVMAYYGFAGTEEYTQAQYRTEPGIGGVISLSPTDFYKIQTMLDEDYPGLYEVVLANEFLEYATTYQDFYGTLR